ncbi:ABC transporter ATP-binding protein [Defluviitalea phaphyphila]|uniref:ABC transporter ATP-binding protein n=1 Tax=Defluviitalea phaphyphila TaxID=1473580 RepID=UPI000730B655|nr:ABC transporter ATP-binding protein [Defluviitalea phaphyphila]
MIKVESLYKSFEKIKVLNNINLNVKKGSIYGLIGPNGAGKTTLIKHLTGTFKQDKGKITIDGEPIYENIKTKQKIGYIPDELFFFSQYNIKQMASFYKKIYPTWNQKRYENLQKFFNINEKRKISHLSKGMQRQVAFWLTLSIMPKVMILDEPIDGLDPLIRKKVWNLIIQDVAEREMSVLISSHNLKEIENVCDYVGILNNGEIVLERDLDDLKSDIYKIQVAYKNDIPQKLINKDNILYKEKRGSVWVLIMKGNQKDCLNLINSYNPLFVDVLPLTLEEIFMYELGGEGYEIEGIIL